MKKKNILLQNVRILMIHNKNDDIIVFMYFISTKCMQDILDTFIQHNFSYVSKNIWNYACVKSVNNIPIINK